MGGGSRFGSGLRRAVFNREGLRKATAGLCSTLIPFAILAQDGSGCGGVGPSYPSVVSPKFIEK